MTMRPSACGNCRLCQPRGEGMPGFEALDWTIPMAPKGLPTTQLNAETVKALQSPELQTFIADGGPEPMPTDPEESDRFVDSTIRKWGPVVTRSGTQVD